MTVIVLPTVITGRDPGDETPEDRFLIDESELERRLAEARQEGYAEGYGDCLEDHNIDAAVC